MSAKSLFNCPAPYITAPPSPYTSPLLFLFLFLLPFSPPLLSFFLTHADTPSTEYAKSLGVCDLRSYSKSFSKHSPGIIIMRIGGKYVNTLVPITKLTHPLLPHHPSTNHPLYPQIHIHRHTQKFKPLIPFIERFIVRCEKKKKMIFIVRMIVNVRTLWLSLIQLRLRCFVATFSAVYNRRISNLHDPSDATRYVFSHIFFFLIFFSRKEKWHVRKKARKQIWDKRDYRRSMSASPKIIRGCYGHLSFSRYLL